MKKFVLAFLCATVMFGICSRDTLADKIFGTGFNNRYVNGTSSEDWEKSVKKAKCYLCHVKGKKKEYCNTYGDAMAKYLDRDNFDKDRQKAEPEKVAEEIQVALEKTEADKDTCGTTFAELLKAEKLPTKDMGAASVKLEEENKAKGDDDDEEDDDDDDDDEDE